MFVGHYATALAAKRAAPSAPLALLVFAAFWIDLLWPVLLLLGVETVRIVPGITLMTPLDFESYPVSHSLLAVVGWGALVGGLAWWRLRDARAAWVTGAVVVSHWVLDWLTHRPDLPLWPGGPEAGLGLWNSMAGTLGVEGLLLAVGVWLYASVSRPTRPSGRWAFVGLTAFLAVTWLANFFGPPPPSAGAIAVTALALWLLLPWAAWIERNREAATP
ncbi:MAG: hypothetical protein AMXMBFR53_18470 [Gemmatimonadota bacterium]